MRVGWVGGWNKLEEWSRPPKSPKLPSDIICIWGSKQKWRLCSENINSGNAKSTAANAVTVKAPIILRQASATDFHHYCPRCRRVLDRRWLQCPVQMNSAGCACWKYMFFAPLSYVFVCFRSCIGTYIADEYRAYIATSRRGLVLWR